MAHDPARVAEARAWIVRAARDLRAADHEFQAVPPLLDDIVFHAQQAAEKALKGFLTWHDRPFRKTHSLEELGEQSLMLDPALRPIIDRAVPLTEYAWKFRYPGESLPALKPRTLLQLRARYTQRSFPDCPPRRNSLAHPRTCSGH